MLTYPYSPSFIHLRALSVSLSSIHSQTYFLCPSFVSVSRSVCNSLSFSCPQTQLSEDTICWPPSQHNQWVQGPTTCHVFFFLHPRYCYLCSQTGELEKSPCFTMQQGCGGRMSKVNCWKPLVQNLCLALRWWFEFSFYPFWLRQSSRCKDSSFDNCIKVMTYKCFSWWIT